MDLESRPVLLAAAREGEFSAGEPDTYCRVGESPDSLFVAREGELSAADPDTYCRVGESPSLANCWPGGGALCWGSVKMYW